MAIPDVTLSNGQKMPILGLGTWKSKPGELKQAVKIAIDVGYRHIDCALVYANENEVGEAINEAISAGQITREELFITSKCWNTYHGREKVTECCKKSLASLGVEYIDMYLIHWPFAFKEGDSNFPMDAEGNTITIETDYLETWKGMEDCYNAGYVKSIGLSNFNSEQIDRVLSKAIVKPVNLQVECHPYLNQEDLIAFCQERGITITAYSPLGSPDRPMGRPEQPVLMDEPSIKEIAVKHNKSVAQVLIKYQIQRGVIVIPKSVTKERIAANIDVLDFELSADDLKVLNSFPKYRLLGLGWVDGHKHFPFNIPY